MNCRILPPLPDERVPLRSRRTFQRFTILVFQILLLSALSLSIFETAFAQIPLVSPSPPTDLHIVTNGVTGTMTAPLDIPSLNWQPLSDWINVKTSIAPAAIGDGVADDTAALQAALNMTNVGKTIYLPAGTYKITQTLAMHGPAAGSTLIGNGRDTRIVWDGPAGGRMFWSDGIGYSRYIGLSWDGSNTAAVGFDHASTKTFETEVQHQDESFRNFTRYGIRVGNNQVVASAEILYRNCLFKNCGTAIGLLTFNDYDNTIDHCEFENCGMGVYCHNANFCARDSHFQNSSNQDFYLYPEHGCSIRRCTSSGSAQFIFQQDNVSTLTLQDCQIANWVSNASIELNASPVTVFDCVFTNGPSNSFPIEEFYNTDQLSLCDNSPSNPATLVSGNTFNGYGMLSTNIYIIPKGKLTGVLTNARQTFLQQSVTVPTQIFDAKVNYGAQGNGSTDDTAAIQSTINAAMSYGQGAMAYLPTGKYMVSKTLLVTGGNYTVGGSGIRSGLAWKGTAGLPFIIVSNVQNVTLANFSVGNANFGTMAHGYDMWITSASNQPCQLTLDGIYGYGEYANASDTHGICFDSLPTGSSIVAQVVNGNLQITNCSQASLIFRTSYEGIATIRGPASTNNMAGFMFRLTTTSDPALQVFDNQSVVMSDFYTESDAETATIYGTNGNNVGAVTIQAPKMTLEYATNNPFFDIDHYNGRIYCGGVQYYAAGPTNTVFQSRNSTSLQLLFVCNRWYDNAPVFSLDANTTLSLMGNTGNSGPLSKSNITTAAMSAISASLDDLRHLGQLDYSLSPSNP